MKISTKGRYALRLMLDLAVYGGNTYVPLKEIASRQQISDKYLEQIATPLSRAGYVLSVRGAQGGYRLAHPPKAYTVGMILRLMEGSLAPVDCVENGGCDHMDSCVTIEVWRRMKEAIDGVVDSITLQDLLDWQREKAAIDFSI
jgi:Rrf2 family protein